MACQGTKLNRKKLQAESLADADISETPQESELNISARSQDSEADILARSHDSDEYQSCSQADSSWSDDDVDTQEATKEAKRIPGGSSTARKGDAENVPEETDSTLEESYADDNPVGAKDPTAEVVSSRILKTTNGRDLLYLDGYYYVKDKTRDESHYWECRNRKHGKNSDSYCAGRAVTTVAAGGIHEPRKLTPHSHVPDPMKVDDLKLRQFLKEDAVVSLAAPSRVASEAGARVSNATQARMSKNAQRQIIKRARTACTADPKTIAELSVPENLRISLDGDKFYHGCVKSEKGQCAFLFTTEGDLRRMARATYWTGDGTFGLSPLLCQLYTLHCSVAPNHDTSVPAVYVLMSSKSEELYIARIYTDFEQAQLNAFRQVFHDVRQSTCFFHFAQALWRNVETKCAVKVSNNYKLYRHYCRVKALAFVPSKEIPNAFMELQKITPPELKQWMDYVDAIYVNGRVNPTTGGKVAPLYDPKLWSVNANVKAGLPRDTNGHESWHARFARQGFKKSRIIPLINALQLEQKAAQGKVCEIQAGLKTVDPNAVDHNQQLLDVVKDYKKLRIIEYLDAIDAHLH
ncbi:hypothetical protein quinque_009643 [Culex quinquefasciatus]